MGLWIATVLAFDERANGWYFEVAALADTKKGASRRAKAAVARKYATYTSVKVEDVEQLDVYSTDVILISRKEPYHAD